MKFVWADDEGSDVAKRAEAASIFAAMPLSFFADNTKGSEQSTPAGAQPLLAGG